MRVEFRLTMPGVASWNDKWTGAGRNYYVIRHLSKKTIDFLSLPSRWHHRWDDGWCACVSGRIIPKGERLKKSDGFYGYEWMVDNIVRHNQTEAPAKTEEQQAIAQQAPCQN